MSADNVRAECDGGASHFFVHCSEFDSKESVSVSEEKKSNHFNCHRESKTRKQGAFLLKLKKKFHSTLKNS